MSDLPVHQDGTCNGLQHYAALGGDAQGARQVNLSVTDKPSDVYTYVADMVQKSMQEDIANGDRYAAMLDGKIARKVVKQTVRYHYVGVFPHLISIATAGHDHCLRRYFYWCARTDRTPVERQGRCPR